MVTRKVRETRFLIVLITVDTATSFRSTDFLTAVVATGIALIVLNPLKIRFATVVDDAVKFLRYSVTPLDWLEIGADEIGPCPNI